MDKKLISQAKIKVDYEVDTLRVLGITNSSKGDMHCRFQLFVRWPENSGRNTNPFTYNGFNKGRNAEPEEQLCSLLRLFQRNFKREHYFFAYLYDTLYLKSDYRRTVMAYVNGVVEENRLKNYYMMLEKMPLIELLKYEETGIVKT